MEMPNNIRYANVSALEQYYADKPAEINKENERGITPLLAAIASGRPEVVDFFLRMKANPNYTSLNTTLPLIFAIDGAVEADDYEGEETFTKALDIIRLLVQYGASPEIFDKKEEQSPNEYAVGRLPEVKTLFNVS